MPSPASRREFLGQLLLTGSSLPAVAARAQPAPTADSRPAQIESDFLRATFDAATGRLSVWRRPGGLLLERAMVRANTSQGRRSTAEPRYQHRVEEHRRRDALGEGRQLLVRCTDAERELDLELSVTLLEQRPAVVIEATARNVSSRPIFIESLEPLCASPEEGGSLHWPGATKLMTNGALYSDPGTVADFAASGAEARRSWWNISVFRGYGQEGLVCGYLRNQQALGQVVVRRAAGDQIGVAAESVLAKGFVLRPGQAVNSEPFMVAVAPDPYTALEDYAEAMGRLNAARVSSILNGWCHWFYEMIKVDFVEWSLLSAHQYHDPTQSRATVYRKGFEIMRRAIGPACHLQDCGPGPVTVGLLDSMRIELKEILPSSGEAARPVDLFDTNRQTVFALKVRRPFGAWTVVGVFNPDEADVAEHVLPLDRLWLDPTRKYIAYDFWRERWHGEVQGTLRVRVPPAGVTLLAVHEQREVPHVVSTDRHVLQGSLELEAVRWDASTQTLEGVSLGPAGTAHNVIVYVPHAQPWKQGGPFLFHDFDGYTLKMVDAHLLRVRVRFERGPRVAWKISFENFLGSP